jgi:hypothetical protein
MRWVGIRPDECSGAAGLAGRQSCAPHASAAGPTIRRWLGHMKAEGHLGRCYLKGRAGDAANVILSAVGYNLRLVLAWLRMILRVVLLALLQAFAVWPYKPDFNGRPP